MQTLPLPEQYRALFPAAIAGKLLLTGFKLDMPVQAAFTLRLPGDAHPRCFATIAPGEYAPVLRRIAESYGAREVVFVNAAVNAVVL